MAVGFDASTAIECQVYPGLVHIWWLTHWQCCRAHLQHMFLYVVCASCLATRNFCCTDKQQGKRLEGVPQVTLLTAIQTLVIPCITVSHLAARRTSAMCVFAACNAMSDNTDVIASYLVRSLFQCSRGCLNYRRAHLRHTWFDTGGPWVSSCGNKATWSSPSLQEPEADLARAKSGKHGTHRAKPSGSLRGTNKKC